LRLERPKALIEGFPFRSYNQAEGDVIFIGGLEGLSTSQVDDIVNKYPPTNDMAKPDYASGSFVNLCVIAIKPAGGTLAWHFQSKLVPSNWEQDRNMALGRRVLYFDAPNVKFLCQICFDHLASEHGELLNSALCSKLETIGGDSPTILDYVFVPQANPSPWHQTQRDNTKYLLNYSRRRLSGHLSTIVVINKAAEDQESTQYGHSGLHYKFGTWRVATEGLGPKTYELRNHDNTTSAVFRKRTPSIHVASIIHPSENTGVATDPRRPLDNPRSYLIHDGCDNAMCSCLPGTDGPAGRFVECDCLPCKLRDIALTTLPVTDPKSRWQCDNGANTHRVRQNYNSVRSELLALKPSRARDIMYLLLHKHGNDRFNPDSWTNLQHDAVVQLLSACSVLSEINTLDFDVAEQWTARLNDSLSIVVMDGTEMGLHYEQIRLAFEERFKGDYYETAKRRDPVLIVALRSTGRVKGLVMSVKSDICKPNNPEAFGGSDSFTSATPLRLYICRDDLFEEARRANRIADYLTDKMSEVFN